MNAVEIEEAISLLAEQDFNSESFPFDFLEAFGNKETTIKRLKSDKKSSTNLSDLVNQGGVLQRNNIHILVSSEGKTADSLTLLRESPSTSKAKAKYILTTDGNYFEAEDLSTGESVACTYSEFPDHFGFFLPLAGISAVKQIRDSSFDIRATSRLNKLYVELLSHNPEWDTEERRHDMNHFMARLIFCFFAEDTDIFSGKNIFTDTLTLMSESNASNLHEVISEVFRAMNTDFSDREKVKIKNWANKFPYVNGGLFSGSTETPTFSKIARSYLLHVGSLDWTQINPDIFGSMIQAVTDEEERGSLGMHYTSIPNILKVLNPLFLDSLREQLEQAGDNSRKLLNLRKRLSKIRVFDPACGSGNFLVIAYKQMREIEAEINRRRNETDRHTEVALTNFRGIELKDFPAEIARLALIIAEYQCDLRYRGQKLALAEFLPLEADNWIIHGNALRIDWLAVCPPTGTSVDIVTKGASEQQGIKFENEGGETYICGNPPYLGATVKAPKGASKELREKIKKENENRKEDLKLVFDGKTKNYKSLDYVSGWFMKAAEYCRSSNAKSALVSTNSICQGQQVPVIWPLIFDTGNEISFAHTSFKWKNLASNNAGVIVVIIGLSARDSTVKRIFSESVDGNLSVKETENINAYLVPAEHVIVEKRKIPFGELTPMIKGSAPTDGGHLLLDNNTIESIDLSKQKKSTYVRKFHGSEDAIHGTYRYCLWLNEENLFDANESKVIKKRLEQVSIFRQDSTKVATKKLATTPYRFGELRQRGDELPFVIPRHSSENRDFLPFVIKERGDIVADSAFALLNAPLWNLSIVASRLHLVWIATVCGKIKTDFRYSNTLGWNTFPIPKLTEKNKNDLKRCTEEILLTREAHFPKTLADLYDPEKMPEDLRLAHAKNDEVLERIYIGRRFKNDTERLEKLFDLYTKVTSSTSFSDN